MMNQISFRQNAPDCLLRIQGRIWILEYNLHFFAILKIFFPVFTLENILSLKKQFTGSRILQAHDYGTNGTFSTSALSNKPQCLSFFQGKADIIHCVECLSASHLKILFQIFHFNQRFFFFSHIIVLPLHNENMIHNEIH